jgi:hypothetical protein
MRSILPTILFGLAASSAIGCETSEPAVSSDDYTLYQPAEVENRADDRAVNGFSIGGQEYWPYKEAPPLYPQKIRWGFSAGSAPAQKCMAKAERDLEAILQNPPAELVALKQQTGIASFFSWNNDYTDAARDGMAPPGFRRLWLYKGNLIKWISETNKDGSCLIPDRNDLRSFAQDCLNQVRPGMDRSTLRCLSGNVSVGPEATTDAGAPRDSGTDAR